MISDRIKQMGNDINEEDKKTDESKKPPRLNFKRRYELFHYVFDLLNLYTPIEIIGMVEENGGLSGNYRIRIYDYMYEKYEIDDIGRNVLKRLYREKKGKRVRISIEWDNISNLYL